MSLITEDGSGMASAESLCSVSFADTYHALRGMTNWALLSTPDKEAALRRASDYMESVYRQRWAGTRLTLAQALSWPRQLVPQKDAPGMASGWVAYYPINTIPLLVQQASAELALRAASGELSPDVSRLKSHVKTGPIETSYLTGASPYVRFRLVDNMLRPFFDGNSGDMNIRLIRA